VPLLRIRDDDREFLLAAIQARSWRSFCQMRQVFIFRNHPHSHAESWNHGRICGMSACGIEPAARHCGESGKSRAKKAVGLKCGDQSGSFKKEPHQIEIAREIWGDRPESVGTGGRKSSEREHITRSKAKLNFVDVDSRASTCLGYTSSRIS
jgi:hypothetical protein